jgi:hypothetical protein
MAPSDRHLSQGSAVAAIEGRSETRGEGILTLEITDQLRDRS